MNTTREGKPFCPDHVEMHPYVQGVVTTRNLRIVELDSIAKGKQVKEDSSLLEEILIHITNYGPKTVERLSKDLMISVPVMKKIIKTMRRKGIIKTSRTARGSTIVRLP